LWTADIPKSVGTFQVRPVFSSNCNPVEHANVASVVVLVERIQEGGQGDVAAVDAAAPTGVVELKLNIIFTSAPTRLCQFAEWPNGDSA